MNNNKKTITIMAQAFYGNRTLTEINPDNLDNFVLGYLNNNIAINEDIDRTVVRVPNTESIVIIYNKYEENKMTEKNKLKPLVIIPEYNLEIYSRCIVCRMNEVGEFEDLQKEDYNKFVKYLAE